MTVGRCNFWLPSAAGWRPAPPVERGSGRDFEGQKAGREGLQDKGNASGALLTIGLHIVFSGGTASRGGGTRLAAPQ